jgi:hypothetical protein
MASLDREIVAVDRVRERLFVGLPVKVRGSTGSRLDPVAGILHPPAAHPRRK